MPNISNILPILTVIFVALATHFTQQYREVDCRFFSCLFLGLFCVSWTANAFLLFVIYETNDGNSSTDKEYNKTYYELYDSLLWHSCYLLVSAIAVCILYGLI